MNEELNFKISAGLKNIIGKELITDKCVAIFELVKNSFDANSNKVQIIFNYNNNIISSIDIKDCGCGMNYEKIKNNWLNVAYSDKKKINAEKKGIKYTREQLGAKGVGRFSCDIVGAKLDLFSKQSDEVSVNHILINWVDFENNDDKNFMDIPVIYSYDKIKDFPVHGTQIHISNLRENWDREEILKLKRMLMKLVLPRDDISNSDFQIEIIAEQEKTKDKMYNNPRDIVNGVVKNILFESLKIKSVSLNTEISDDGQKLKIILNDKGQLVFEIVSNNSFNCLKNIHLKLFYMNRAAKKAFASIMGISQASYGNIFVFKNGFRILPYGEPTDDFFDINRRQQQGTKRYFGTRDLVGRIEINGEATGFVEVSSRDKGFINTRQVDELKKFFIESMKILEKYVVDVLSWGDNDTEEFKKEDINIEKLIKQITSISSNNTIFSIKYDESLIKSRLIESLDNSIESTLEKVAKIALKNNNSQLCQLIDTTKKQVTEVKLTNKTLKQNNENAQRDIANIKKELSRKESQIYFLENSLNNSIKLQEIIHLSMIYANSIVEYLDSSFIDIKEKILDEPILEKIAQVQLLANKIYNLSKFGLKSNFSLKSDVQKSDLTKFISEYIENIYNKVPNLGMKIMIENNVPNRIELKFNAAEIVCLIENLISNSNKANAQNMYFIMHNNDKYLFIDVIDDGNGLDKTIQNKNDIFKLGYTSTYGSGIGLYSVCKILKNINGTIEIIDTKLSFSLRIKIKYGH